MKTTHTFSFLLSWSGAEAAAHFSRSRRGRNKQERCCRPLSSASFPSKRKAIGLDKSFSLGWFDGRLRPQPLDSLDKPPVPVPPKQKQGSKKPQANASKNVNLQPGATGSVKLYTKDARPALREEENGQEAWRSRRKRIKEKSHLPPSSYAKQSPYIQPSLAVNAGVDGQALYRPQQNFAQEVSLPDITHSVHQTNNSTQKQPPISVRNADMKTPPPPPLKRKTKEQEVILVNTTNASHSRCSFASVSAWKKTRKRPNPTPTHHTRPNNSVQQDTPHTNKQEIHKTRLLLRSQPLPSFYCGALRGFPPSLPLGHAPPTRTNRYKAGTRTS